MYVCLLVCLSLLSVDVDVDVDVDVYATHTVELSPLSCLIPCGTMLPRRLPACRETVIATAFSLNWDLDSYPKIWSADPLPHDCVDIVTFQDPSGKCPPSPLCIHTLSWALGSRSRATPIHLLEAMTLPRAVFVDDVLVVCGLFQTSMCMRCWLFSQPPCPNFFLFAAHPLSLSLVAFWFSLSGRGPRPL